MNTINNNQKKEGFALLTAMLIVSILLAVGLSVSEIVLKELILSRVARDSTLAFYAADTGAECALYWDKVGNGSGSVFVNPPSNIDCVGEMRSVNGNGNTYEFQINFSNGSCVDVDVYRGGGSNGFVEITSDGYNVGCDSSSPRKVNRTLFVSYPK